jgi:hypothetical protein
VLAEFTTISSRGFHLIDLRIKGPTQIIPVHSINPCNRGHLLSSSVEQSDRSFAVVTPTFLPDLARCELLAESLDRTLPDASHYLIVDRRDRAAFQHLQRGRRRLIDAEEILGKWIKRMPGRQGYWLSLKAPPVRGWIMQQIKKIGAIEVIPERTLVFCDSDTAFFRPFGREDLLVNGKIGLLDVDFNNESTRRWTTTARRLLGLPASDGDYRNHIGYLVCWNRETVKAMQQRIEMSTGLNWQVALSRTLTFSEYMIYGIFVREVLGYEAVDHAPSTVPLIKPAFGLSTAAIETFFTDFDPRTVGVMIHSKDGIDVSRYRRQLERLWERAERK